MIGKHSVKSNAWKQLSICTVKPSKTDFWLPTAVGGQEMELRLPIYGIAFGRSMVLSEMNLISENGVLPLSFDWSTWICTAKIY